MRILLSLLLFALLLAPRPARAQAAPYVTSAKLHCSVDYWGEFYINGYPLWDFINLPMTRSRPLVNPADQPGSLCNFGRENVLGIVLTDGKRPEDLEDDQVGIAYVLEIGLSNGSKVYLSSDETSEHSAYYAQEGKPRGFVGWAGRRFLESGWLKALGNSTKLPHPSSVIHPGTGLPVKFMTASGSYRTRVQGEEHYFRRRFYLNISPRPGCVPPTPTPAPRPEVVPEGARREPESFIPPPPPTSTRTPVPTHTQAPTRTATATRTFTHLPSMPAKYLPSPQAPVVLTATPRPRPKTATPTPTVRVISRETMEAIIRRAPAVASPEFHRVPDLPVPMPTPKPRPPADVRFEMGAAILYVTFRDGPGRYRAQVEDGTGKVLKVLLDEKVVGESDLWLEWDGTNSQGAEVPAGDYQVVYSKDGKLLRTITVRK